MYMVKTTMEELRKLKMVEGEVREMAIEYCLGGTAEERIKCMDEMLAWSPEKIYLYLAEVLPKEDFAFYEKHPKYFNSVFKDQVKNEKKYISD